MLWRWQLAMSVVAMAFHSAPSSLPAKVQLCLLCRALHNRKTWLFCGHDVSARRTADALTIITTCKKLGIDPRSYFRDTLRRILDGEKSLSLLLPENYKPDAATRVQEPVAA
jgi:hypothetical protein